MSRPQRLAELIKKEISDVLLTRIRDKRLNFVTITNVEVSDDMSAAKIYYSVLEQKKFDGAHARKAMEAASGFMRREIGQRIETRIVPSLKFIYDDSLAKSTDLINKLSAIRRDDAQRQAAAEAN